MGKETKGPWKSKGGGPCAWLRETIRTVYRDNAAQLCPRRQIFVVIQGLKDVPPF